MKKFIKENWFKVGITFALLILALSVAYYLVVFIPAQKKLANLISQQNNTTSIELQAKCTTQAQKTFNDFKENMTANLAGGDFSQHNHYNPVLNKCFILISYLQTFGLVNHDYGTEKEVLFDAFENKELATATCSNNEDGSCSTPLFKTYKECLAISGNPCAKPFAIYFDIDAKQVSYEDYANFVRQKMESGR